MRKAIGLILLSFVFSINAFAAAEHTHTPKVGSPEFEKLKTLAGAWKGTMTEMDGKVKDASAEYKVTSAGSALVETLFPGSPDEMVSVYHDDENGKLTMTHYCAVGNQPQLDLKKAENNTFELELSPSSKLTSVPHMHALKLDLKDSELIQAWTYYQDGKPGGTTTITLKKA